MRFLIASIIGAIIGYTTNWLAIKMLFRPHGERKLFGISLPFTPGLIPKERSRIAKSVGDTVGTHLLTAEAIKTALCSDKMNEQLKDWIDNRVGELKKSDSTIGGKIKASAGEGYDQIISSMEHKLTEVIVGSLRGEETELRVLNTLEVYIARELSASPKELLLEEFIRSSKESILNKLKIIKNSEEFEGRVEGYVAEKIQELQSSDKCINEIVPQSILEAVKSYIYSNRSDICLGIGETLKQPEMEVKIKKLISSIISSNLSPLVAMFINPDMVYGKLTSALEDYFKEDENQRNTALAINQGFERITRNKISDMLSSSKEEQVDGNIKSITQYITTNVITGKVISDIILEIEEILCEYDSINEILLDLDSDYLLKLREFLGRRIKFFTMSREFECFIAGFVKDGLGQMLDRPIREFINDNENNITSMSSNIARDIFDRFVENEAAEMVEALNIPRIVEDRINSFDVAFAEKVIVEIAHKELSAITWLGALLGGLIGILSPILGSL
jgi:uncharacterized membrane protein YheB (UPF0754 family)